MVLRTTRQRWGVTLDAPDAQALARFYQRLLGWRIFTDSEEWVTLAPSATAGYNLAFLREDDYQRPVWPPVAGRQQKSMHLEIEVDVLTDAVAHAVECGAEVASFQPQDDVRVMLDPAGHPFCLYLDHGL